MPEMHAVATRPAPCVEEERLPLLIPVKDGAEIADNGHLQTLRHK